ncbi:uncharacterized protein LOC110988260 [Acanthaster planci]|uniref:Uncharacterized protein LOC110988260 n=1 Tax=Acanthaster planci TaxID=133434 RepID=A0A8B7ZUV4_ACAPL|nr:uncharacterized protein LOC110988260 [Acanthaster planci]
MHIIRAPSLDEAEAPRQGVESWISGNTQHQEGSSWAGGEEDEATDHTQDGIAEETKDGATDTALTKEPHASDRRRTIEDDGSNLKNPQVEKETVQSNASTFANLNASRSEQDCVKAEEHLAIKDDANPLQEQEAGESRSRAKKHKSIVSFVEPETRHDPGEPTREQRTEGMVVGGSKAEPGEVFSAELREDNGVESALVATEVSTATDANVSLSTDAVGGSTHQLPPLTEMQDVTATFHSIPTSPGHRRIGSNVSLDEMTSLTQSMNAYAESLPPSSPTGGSGDLAESTVGFVEALRGKSREDLSDAERLAQQREALMSSPLTDSEIDCMEPLNQDGHIS